MNQWVWLYSQGNMSEYFKLNWAVVMWALAAGAAFFGLGYTIGRLRSWAELQLARKQNDTNEYKPGPWVPYAEHPTWKGTQSDDGRRPTRAYR